MKRFKEKAKYALAGVVPAVTVVALPMTSYASEGGSTDIMDSVTSSLVTSVTSMASSIGSAIGQVIPLALPVIGAVLVITIGIKVFKNVSNKA